MYRKKEVFLIVLILCVIVVLGIVGLIQTKPVKKQLEVVDDTKEINIQIEGEIVRPVQLIFSKPISYGVLFLRVENVLNEYSNLTEFDLDEMISSDVTIFIPSFDTRNELTTDARVCINEATLSELIQLPQIGEKRGQKILDYIRLNGRINSWDIFFKIVGVPEHAKTAIQQQAFL